MWVGLLTSMYSMYFTVLCNKKLLIIKVAEKKKTWNASNESKSEKKRLQHRIWNSVILQKKCRDYSLSAAYSISRAFFTKSLLKNDSRNVSKSQLQLSHLINPSPIYSLQFWEWLHWCVTELSIHSFWEDKLPFLSLPQCNDADTDTRRRSLAVHRFGTQCCRDKKIKRPTSWICGFSASWRLVRTLQRQLWWAGDDSPVPCFLLGPRTDEDLPLLRWSPVNSG